jgi:hypothetical protein
MRPDLIVALLTVGVASAAQAQFELDLSTTADVQPVIVLPPVVRVTTTTGGSFVGVNTKKTTERFDLTSLPKLTAAFVKQLEGKVVATDKVLAELKRISPAALHREDERAKLVTALSAGYLVLVELDAKGAHWQATVWSKTGVEVTPPLVADEGSAFSSGVVDSLARKVAETLTAAAKKAKPAVAAVEPVVAPPPPPEDVAVEVEETTRAAPKQELITAPWLVVAVGLGPSFRGLRATSVSPIVPQSPSAMLGLTADLEFSPLRLVPSLANTKFTDVIIEGRYRRNVAQAEVVGDPTSSGPCAVTDDELLARLKARYPLGGRLPSLGASVAFAQERTAFACAVPTLSTTWQSTELMLQVMERLIDDRLTLEVAGGPRFVSSVHAAGFPHGAFAIEAWVRARPTAKVSVRAGARLTDTALTTWPDGVNVVDLRVFAGVEVGVAL